MHKPEFEQLKKGLKRLWLVKSLWRIIKFFIQPIETRLNKNKIINRGDLDFGCQFEFWGKNNSVEIGKDSVLRNLVLKVQGNNHKIRIGENCQIFNSEIFIEDEGCRVQIGNFTTAAGIHLGVCENHSIIEIGEDCMFSAGIIIRCSDAHSILDKTTGKRINPPGNVTIGDHVWVGNAVKILKGVTVGKESIIGIGSIVTKSVPPNTLVAGIPAVKIKENITWSRTRLPG